MQWGQIKTVFIVCFLVLNIFLVGQLINRQEEEISFIQVTSREEELEFNINGLDELSDEVFTAPLIYAHNYNYNLNEEVIAEVTNQQIVVINNFFLFSRFNEPIPINLENPNAELGDHILNGDNYSYWGKIESAQILVFFQNIRYPIFHNPNAILFVHLNGDGQMTQYVQTQLVGEQDEDRSLIQQYDAVYRLYHHSNELQTGDTISNVHLGYHNLVSLPNGEQLLNPTWDIQVNERDHHFVNAIDGHDYPQNEQFYQENINNFVRLLERPENEDIVFYHLEDEEDEERIMSTIRQALEGVYQNIVEVGSE